MISRLLVKNRFQKMTCSIQDLAQNTKSRRGSRPFTYDGADDLADDLTNTG
jgi:hypothetical protein